MSPYRVLRAPEAGSRHIVALAGGVGGAKLADGLAQCLFSPDPSPPAPPSLKGRGQGGLGRSAERLTVIVNTGDDFEHLGLQICPDLDTVCYTLGNLANIQTGWGRTGETWRALETVAALGGPGWFRLGDSDIGLHLERTRRLRAAESLSQITQQFCRAWGIQAAVVVPVSDDPVRTIVSTNEFGDLPFQEYFVKHQCQPTVAGFRFDGVEFEARPGVIEAIQQADCIIFCPSNPWVSIDPILAVPGVRQAIVDRRCPVIAVSPIISGTTIKGPAAKMFQELGIQPSALAVAEHYGALLDGFVIDRLDHDLLDEIRRLGIMVYETNSIMVDRDDRARLAKEILAFYESLGNHPHQTP